MNEILMLLALAYIFLLALLMLVLTHGRLPWFAKGLLLFLAAGLYWLSYQGWKEVQGWPTLSTLPDRFLLHASVIEEPDPEKGATGRIFIWASSLQGNFPASEPRAYEIPYGREVHSSLEDALRNQREGNVQIGEVVAEAATTGKAPVSIRQLGEASLQLKFHKLADPALPEK